MYEAKPSLNCGLPPLTAILELYNIAEDPLEEVDLADDRILVPVCPEQLGGLPTPRPRHYLERGTGEDVLAGRSRVVNDAGGEATEHFLRGARMVLRVAELAGAGEAWFKEKSPSCGVCWTARAGETVPGSGVTTALLREHGIVVRGFP